MNIKSPSYPPSIIGFSALYMLVAIITAVVQRNTEFVFYIVVMIVLISCLVIMHKRVNFSPGVLWAMSIWGFLHMAGGLVKVSESLTENGSQPVLYSWWIIPEHLKYDQLVHAYGFGITTLMCWQIFRANIERQTGKTPESTFGLCLLSAAAGMGFGALNEVIEFIATLTIPKTNVGGYVNTGWDLVYNFLGCSIAAILISIYHKRHR